MKGWANAPSTDASRPKDPTLCYHAEASDKPGDGKMNPAEQHEIGHPRTNGGTQHFGAVDHPQHGGAQRQHEKPAKTRFELESRGEALVGILRPVAGDDCTDHCRENRPGQEK